MILPTDSMTATERFEAIINRTELPDRIPCHLMGIPDYSTTRIEFLRMEDELMEQDPFFEDERNMLFTPLGDKTFEYYFGAEDTGYSTGEIKTLEFILDENHEIITDPGVAATYKGKPSGEYVNYKGRRNGWQILDSGHRYTWFIDGYLKDRRSIEAWYGEHGWPHEQPIPPVNVPAVHEFQNRFGDRMYLNGGLSRSGLFEETWFMMGMDSFAQLCFKETDFMHEVIDAMLVTDLNAVEAIKPCHFDVIYMSDDLGQKGRPLISPRMFRKFFFEPYQDLFGAIHNIGAKVFLHSCGNIVELLPMLIEAGLDGWQSMEVPSEIDHAAVKKKYGGDIILIGGIDSSRVLTFGNKESIRQHVKEQMTNMGKGGGYIAGPAHDYLKVSLENAIHMRDAIHDFGRYSIG